MPILDGLVGDIKNANSDTSSPAKLSTLRQNGPMNESKSKIIAALGHFVKQGRKAFGISQEELGFRAKGLVQK